MDSNACGVMSSDAGTKALLDDGSEAEKLLYGGRWDRRAENASNSRRAAPMAE